MLADMPAPPATLDRPLAIVDLETTGISAADEFITEIAIISWDGGRESSRWSTLVNPGVPIPTEIQWLTGITNEMVRDAPSFADIAHDVHQRLAGRVFVAHNARFDYSFLKSAFERCDMPFRAPILCTVRLSRALFPAVSGHGLDMLVARHNLATENRHRAMGDADAVSQFLSQMRRRFEVPDLEAACQRICRAPSLPARIDHAVIKGIEDRPGVYLFYGDNDLPIYIGKSKTLRTRIRAHFANDHASGSEQRLQQQTERIDVRYTVGELGALFLEARLIKQLMPAHNVQLRRRANLVALQIEGSLAARRIVAASDIDPRSMSDVYGPFSSRAAIRATLRALAREHNLCERVLGLERGSGPCFSRQLKKCLGACVEAEPLANHAERLRDALLPLAIPPWPFDGPVALRELDATGNRAALHICHHWCYLGEALDDVEADTLAATRSREFDLDLFRLIRSALAKRVEVLPLRAADAVSAA